ncbi:hypothetical protein [Pararhodobacter aggregans]|uniref:DnaA N-terminal domain-containing protein n=1 Tax=Pararhodobacter aggregans TaxID=404875 RepID=A0A2T7UK89_9RHOB|nr:hypothetical protein [Pararhodobacter aggregans]PTX03233.1 hypothetical protein C8N33_10334 [Pararhodobacter aggregans]PVE45088.1 hypothetical protein DDE23_23245 [Pararhodobacter aggregans]
MSTVRPLGNGAAARKYDLLTALGTMGLAATPGEQRLVLRLMVAITARYNWASDTLAVAQSELAKLWAVDERTVKRAMAEYRARGWLRLKRQAARGRVAEYGLGIERLMEDTRPVWAIVGPDFAARLTPAEPAPAPDPKIVRFPLPATEGILWPRVLQLIAESDGDTARAWLQGLGEEPGPQGVLRLVARGRYQASYVRTHLAGRLLAAARRVDPAITSVEIACETA